MNQDNTGYQNLLNSISATYVGGQHKAIKLARREMLLTYWHIGQHIVEFEQQGQDKAPHGIKLIEQISIDLSHQLGREFSRSNLIYMRLCYLKYNYISLLSHQLTWAYYRKSRGIENTVGVYFELT